MRACFSLLALALSLSFSGSSSAFTPAEIDQAALVARQIDIISTIADDIYLGRDNDTPESTAVQQVLIDELKLFADGLNPAETGDDGYRQPFSTTATGTNLVAVIPGADPNEYVMLGAHYDHLGFSGPDIFNGATDNASGTAIVLAIGAAIDSLPSPPGRSVILALWDAEEDGLVGSEFFATSPLVPLSKIIAYVNFDIQGSNLLPSIRNLSLAIGAESGGTVLQSMVDAAVMQQSVDTRRFSRLFGQERSDHANFIDTIPSVFFTDATGPCYHTPGDDITIVDFGKLREQSQIAFRLTVDLTETPTPPPLVPTTIFAGTYQDAVVLSGIINGAILDLTLFSPTEQANLLSAQADAQAIVDAGEGAFDVTALGTIANVALTALAALATLECDGFLSTQAVPALPPHAQLVLLLLLLAGGLLALRWDPLGARAP